MLQDRWTFGKVIFENPLERTCRLAYADWLHEHNCFKAESRQRIYAQHMQNALLLIKVGNDLWQLYCKKNNNEVIRMEFSKSGSVKISGSSSGIKHSYSGLLQAYIYHNYRKSQIRYPRYNESIAKSIHWIDEQVLLDACKAAGITRNSDILQAGAVG